MTNDLIEKVARAIEDVEEEVDCWDYCYEKIDPLKAAKASVAVVLREQLAQWAVLNDAYPEECLRSFARENGIINLLCGDATESHSTPHETASTASEGQES